ncbi:hypothetical protein HPB48_005464 [Haemaphysalis longicornis]|uniref:Uncharacterized protein n=1 Tax=Haemaphysalis longicornis TaxID=44386 RepID=A0A9J6H3G7_HAELO|nr:hypothetical protein HPB48_005464 [Haemaphysalis longicornis]
MSVPPAPERQGVANRTRLEYAVIGAVIGLGLLTVLLVIVQAVFGRPLEGLEDILEFCCPEEATMLLEEVNGSVNPCTNFYDHVCTAVPKSPLNALWSDVLNIELSATAMLPDAANTPVGRTLWHLRQSCSKQNWKPAVALPEFTKGVLAAAKIPRSAAPLGNLSRLVWFQSLVEFRLNSPVALSMRSGGRHIPPDASALTLSWRGLPIRERIYTCPTCLAAIFITLSKESPVNETLARLEKLEIPTPEHDDNGAALEAGDIKEVPFKGLDAVSWNTTLNSLILPIFPSVRVLKRRTKDRIDGVLGRLASNPTIGGLYLIQHTVMELYWYFQDDRTHIFRGQGKCSMTIMKLPTMEAAFQSQLASPAWADGYLRKIFGRIRDTASTMVSSSSLFAHEQDVRVAVNLLSKVVLQLPEVVAVGDLLPPRMTFSFAWNLLHSRSFDFDIARALTARRFQAAHSGSVSPDVIRRDLEISVYAGAYTDLQFWKGKDERRLMDVPVMAAYVARELWSLLLERSELWTTETVQNIRDYKDCFRGAQSFASTESATFTRQDHGFAEWTLALMTVAHAAHPVRWSHERLLAENARISEGRLFYMKWARAVCRDGTPPGTSVSAESVNAPLKHMSDFSLRFKCSNLAPMIAHAPCSKIDTTPSTERPRG